mmetsp:Transcript_96594/g.174415  ORF Transcript_96594/g.174415 Transcript_96594/m.174415 type:complete len:330 (-) Transcript_96594:187-1176(-)
MLLFRLLHDPGADERLDVDVLFRQEDHSQSADGCRGGKPQVVCLEDEVNIRAELDSLSIWHSEEAVVIQHAVQRLHPLRIDVSIAHDPVVRRGWFLDHFSSTSRQDAVEPLSGIVVHVPQKSYPVHRLGIHHVHHIVLALLLVSRIQDFPDGGLAATRWANDADTHPLLARLVELEHLVNLSVDLRKLHLLHRLTNHCLQFLVLDVLDAHPWKEVNAEVLETLGVREGELGESVHTNSLQQKNCLLHVGESLAAGGLALLQQAPSKGEDRLESTETPVIVLLRREELTRKKEQGHNFLCQHLGTHEAFCEHHHLSDELVVWNAHGHRSE